MYSIGEFSKITGLTVKTLRFYHEKELLVPAYVDDQSGYRYYHERQVGTARCITALRELEFSLDQIAEIVHDDNEGGDLLEFLLRQKQMIQSKVKHYRDIERRLEELIFHEQETVTMKQNAPFQVEEKSLEPVLVAGVRMQGKYSDCGAGFAKIGKRFGRQICGKPMLLHYDSEFKENDADFEACMPVRKGTDMDGIVVRALPGGKCVTLLHQGPYEDLGRSYEEIIRYAKQKGYEIRMPTREVYVKGPGMIFRGNPRKYLTEIQMLID